MKCTSFHDPKLSLVNAESNRSKLGWR